MPFKPGGGEKLQLYNKNNGEYTRNPKCEEDERILVLKKLFNLDIPGEIAYPELGIHDDDYCDSFVACCGNFENPFINDDKFTKYLLIHKDVNDKSQLLYLMGYSLNNWEELKKQIKQGTNLRKRGKYRFSEGVLTFAANTTIKNKRTGANETLITIWAIEKDYTIRFITLKKGELK